MHSKKLYKKSYEELRRLNEQEYGKLLVNYNKKELIKNLINLKKQNINSKIICLPADILKFFAENLLPEDICRFGRLNKRIAAIYFSKEFLDFLAAKFLTGNTSRLFFVSNILREIFDIKDIYDAIDRGYEKKIFSRYLNAGKFEYIMKESAKRCYLDIIKYMIEKYSIFNTVRESSFLIAIEEGHINIVEYFVNIGIDINFNESLALVIAIAYDRLIILKYLISRGAGVNSLYIPLKQAVSRNRVAMTEYLISKGAIITNEVIASCPEHNIELRNYLETTRLKK